MKNTIWFDLDGTLAGLYDVPNWLPMLIASDPTPYKLAAPLVNMNTLARKLNRLQRAGYKIGVISWLSKSSTPEYDKAVTAAKLWWLNKHLTSVSWDEIKIVAYGTSKITECGGGILFDDEDKNRNEWGEGAYEPNEIFTILKGLVA
jgi:hypothetical protein